MPTSPIIPRPDRAGGIVRLAEAVGADPGAGLVLYFRASGRSTEGASVETKAERFERAVRAVVGDRVAETFVVVEKSKLSNPRPGLRRAAEFAAERGCILVAPDRSRFLRAVAYDEVKNPEAWPTPEEFARLREMTKGVPLATVEDPLETEAERRRRSVVDGGGGRPRKIDPETAAAIFRDLGCFYETWGGRFRWERSLKDVAEAFGVSRAAILREADCPSPDGPTWRELAWLKAVERGYMVIGRNGEIEPKMSSKRGPWRDKPGRPPKWAVRGSR